MVRGTRTLHRQLWSAPLGLFLLALLALLSQTRYAYAQPFKTSDPGPGSVTISGKWQFHTGDNPAWANPAFNDSNWEQLRGDDTWGAQTHPAHTGFAWYRRRIEVDGANPSLAILMPAVDDAYEIYWNGKQIGTYGALPPHAWWWGRGRAVVYKLGVAPVSGVLALRVWKAPLSSVDDSSAGGLSAPPVLGSTAVLQQKSMTPRYQAEHRSIPRLLIASVSSVAGLLALLLFLRDRKQWLYLWLSIFLMADGMSALLALDGLRFGLKFLELQSLLQAVDAFEDIPLWLLLLTLFGFSGERRWRRWTVALAILYLVAQAVDMVVLYRWQYAGPGIQWTDGITTAIYSLTPLYIFFIVGFGFFLKKQTELLPIAIAAFLYGLWIFVNGIAGQGIRFTHWTLRARLENWGLHLGGYSFGARLLLDTLLFLVLLFTVTRQQFLERRRQEQIELEVKSAREVQQVLIPEEAPAIPGLAIASVYKPAAELGGDFFQVIPLPAEQTGALVILGDVSGKGLKAAMTVSLIVGALRTLAEYTQQPAAILRGLNQRLMGRTKSGFVTCLVLCIHADGRATLANAGHLSPFRDGKEMPVAGSLPLGIFAAADYEEIDFRLQPDETLTLYTDGVAEARNNNGELYSFDRVSGLLATKPSVQQIVDIVCAFGQQDDITVLSVRRVGELEPHASAVNLVAQIATG